MSTRLIRQSRRRLAPAVLALFLLDCSGHDCQEARNCPEVDTPIDIGEGDGWWNAAGGQMETAGNRDDVDAGAAGSPEPSSAGAAGEGGERSLDGDAQFARVLSVSPEDGAVGVASDARVVVVFSHPMDRATTEAAYQSTELPRAELSFTWNPSSTELTLTPRAPLHYAAADPDSLDGAAQTYHLSFGEGARDDRARPLRPALFSFSTLRRVSLELTADAERTGSWTEGEGEGIHNCVRLAKAPFVPTVCVGDDANDVRYAGFLSFDLSRLPEGISAIESARLLARGIAYGAPASLGASSIEHIAYGELDAAALKAGPGTPLGPFCDASWVDGTRFSLSIDFSAAVAEDYRARGEHDASSQYRFTFSKVVRDGHWDDIELPTAELRLVLSCLLP